MPRIVISASRRTDIPAFYMPWFMSSIGQGYFDVVNPYNQRTYQVPAAPERVHAIVFWSKNFGPFLNHGHGQTLTRLGYRLFFNFTINSPHQLLEPTVPPLQERLDQLALLVDAHGPDSIHWRLDPICFFEDGSGRTKDNLDQFHTIADRAAALGVKICITSFVDLYSKVLRRMKKFSNLQLFDPPMDKKVSLILEISRYLAGLTMQLHLCCEKKVLAALPPDTTVQSASCVPSHRLVALYGPGISLRRDSGQRIAAGCGCGLSKDIGSYSLHPCHHNCLFCYANPAMDRTQ